MRTTFLALLLAAVSYSTRSFAQNYEWQQRADMPAGRWGASTFVIDSVAYVVGGRIGSSDRTEMWAYHLESDSWSLRAPIPVARRLAGSFAIDGKGYVTCGLYSTSSKLNDLWEYDPLSDTWAQKADFPGSARYGTYHFALNGLGYVGMGNLGSGNGPYASDAYRYDPMTDTWSTAPLLPDLARHGTASFVMNEKAYVFGGKESSLLFSPDLWCFNPATDSWSLLSPFPGSPRSSPLAFVYSSDAVIGCGRNDADNFYDVWRYDPPTDQWYEVPEYPGLSSLAGTSFSINGRAFGGLGWVLATNASANDLWELVKPSHTDIDEVTTGTPLISITPNIAVAGSICHVFTTECEPIVLYLIDGRGAIAHAIRFTRDHAFSTAGLAAGNYRAIWRARTKTGTLSFTVCGP